MICRLETISGVEIGNEGRHKSTAATTAGSIGFSVSAIDGRNITMKYQTKEVGKSQSLPINNGVKNQESGPDKVGLNQKPWQPRFKQEDELDRDTSVTDHVAKYAPTFMDRSAHFFKQRYYGDIRV